MIKQQILIIDDDEKLNGLLQNYLQGFGFDVLACTHPHAGLQKIKSYKPDLIILDIMLPDMDGLSVCREIRKDFNIPVLMLTARGDVADRIVGLELGADDYMPKPFEPRELVARIQSILRRTSSENHGLGAIRAGNLELLPEKQQALLNQEPLDLTTMEFQLLKLFVEKKGRIVNRELIIDNLKGMDWSAFDRSVDVMVSRLRQKLQDNPKNPQYIKTIWGNGYMFIGHEE
jgi:two-component system phosphate regulon response regulator OmpR